MRSCCWNKIKTGDCDRYEKIVNLHIVKSNASYVKFQKVNVSGEPDLLAN